MRYFRYIDDIFVAIKEYSIKKARTHLTNFSYGIKMMSGLDIE